MRICFRVIVGKAASGTGGLLPVTRLSASPRTAWVFWLLVVAQTAHAPMNVKSPDFMAVSEMEAITVGELRDFADAGLNAPR